MKCLKIIGWLMFVLSIAAVFPAWVTHHRARCCVKCLVERRVVEERFLGVMLHRDLKETKPPEDYERLFGHPCVHVFCTQGRDYAQGHSLLSGVHSNCVFGYGYRDSRIRALSATYDAERRFHDRELALESFALIDTWMPPNIQAPDPYDPPPSKATIITSLFGQYLSQAKNVEQWRSVVDAARQDFAHSSGLPGVISHFQEENLRPFTGLPPVPGSPQYRPGFPAARPLGP